jgi:hypothetical protein
MGIDPSGCLLELLAAMRAGNSDVDIFVANLARHELTHDVADKVTRLSAP